MGERYVIDATAPQHLNWNRGYAYLSFEGKAPSVEEFFGCIVTYVFDKPFRGLPFTVISKRTKNVSIA